MIILPFATSMTGLALDFHHRFPLIFSTLLCVKSQHAIKHTSFEILMLHDNDLFPG